MADLALGANKPGASSQRLAAVKYIYWTLEAWLGPTWALAHVDKTEEARRE